MPAAITHCLQSQRTLDKLREQGAALPPSRDAFLWGAQGPDFLMCHRFLPWWKGESLARYGDLLHDLPPAKTLSAMWRYVNSRPEDGEARSYAMGFLCHYAADSICHPFVEYGARALAEKDPSQDEGVYHNEIESALDLIFLRYERAALPSEFPLKRTVPHNPAAQAAIARLYQPLFLELFGKQVGTELLAQSLEDCRRIFSLLTDRTGLKKNLVRRLERGKRRAISCHIRGMAEQDGLDYANTLLEEWRWPWEGGAPRRESFFDLYEASVEKAAALIQAAPACTDFEALTGKVPFA